MERHLDDIGALGESFGNRVVGLPSNPKQLAVLEEFVHEKQRTIGKRWDSLTDNQIEIHAKSFMVRHQRMLGLTAEEVKILQNQIDSYSPA